MIKLLWKMLEAFGEARAATYLTRQGQWRDATKIYTK